MKATLLLIALVGLSVLVLAPSASATETCTEYPLADGAFILVCSENGSDVPNYVCVRLPHGECFVPS
jgi:hypothetical protein